MVADLLRVGQREGVINLLCPLQLDGHDPHSYLRDIFTRILHAEKAQFRRSCHDVFRA
jgi:hypothetical protein